MGMCEALLKEFRLKNFGFSGVRTERFCHSQWRLPVAVYMIYRLVLMVYTCFWLSYITLKPSNPPQAWGAYLTNWTYIMLNIYLISHFLAASLHHAMALRRRGNTNNARTYLFSRPNAATHEMMFTETDHDVQSREDYESIEGSVLPPELVIVESSHPPFYICGVWVFFNVISTAALMVTIVFFAFLFRLLSDYPNINLENLQVHLLNSVIIILEHFISAVPYRLLHVIYPFLYGLIYMTFSVIYWSDDHSHVMYPNILDWNQAGTTVLYVLMIGFVIVPILHSFFFFFHKLKMLVYFYCCRPNDEL